MAGPGRFSLTARGDAACVRDREFAGDEERGRSGDPRETRMAR
jgi:hypothetical protein